jgi:hypothetical protein
LRLTARSANRIGGRSLATQKYSRDRCVHENRPLRGSFSANQRKPGCRCAGEQSPKTEREA